MDRIDRLANMAMFDNGLSVYGIKSLSVYCRMNGRGPNRIRHLDYNGEYNLDEGTVNYIGETFHHLDHMNNTNSAVRDFSFEPLHAVGRGPSKDEVHDEYQANIKWRDDYVPVKKATPPPPPPKKKEVPPPAPAPPPVPEHKPKVWHRPELEIDTDESPKKPEDPWVRPPHRTQMLSPKMPSGTDFFHYHLPSPRGGGVDKGSKHEDDLLLTAYYMADSDKRPLPPKKKPLDDWLKDK